MPMKSWVLCACSSVLHYAGKWVCGTFKNVPPSCKLGGWTSACILTYSSLLVSARSLQWIPNLCPHSVLQYVFCWLLLGAYSSLVKEGKGPWDLCSSIPNSWYLLVEIGSPWAKANSDSSQTTWEGGDFASSVWKMLRMFLRQQEITGYFSTVP